MGDLTGDGGRVWDNQRLVSPHAQPDKARRVRAMFNAIAPTYELVNTVFSVGRDRAWRRKSVALTKPQPTDSVLDIACGTGDMVRAFQWVDSPPRRLVGCDFATGMLSRAAQRSRGKLDWVQADALALPFDSDSFSIISCAFGVRNLQDLDAGLEEMHRVLQPGGRVVILEFTRPANRWWRWLYEFYSSRIMPIGATLVSGDRSGAYRYLPRSVVSFANADDMCRRLLRAGFEKAMATPMTLGAVTIYLAIKERDGQRHA